MLIQIPATFKEHLKALLHVFVVAFLGSAASQLSLAPQADLKSLLAASCAAGFSAVLLGVAQWIQGGANDRISP